MKLWWLLLVAVASGLLAQSVIGPPTAGFIRCIDGKLRPVYGVAGNFVLGPPIEEGPRVRPPRRVQTALAFPDGARLFSEEGDLVYRKPDGAEIRTMLSKPVLYMEQMGLRWIHIQLEDRSLAVRLTGDQLEVYWLPEAAR